MSVTDRYALVLDWVRQGDPTLCEQTRGPVSGPEERLPRDLEAVTDRSERRRLFELLRVRLEAAAARLEAEDHAEARSRQRRAEAQAHTGATAGPSQSARR